MDKEHIPLYFSLFNEIGIIEQLSRAAFEARLPDGLLLSHFTVLNHLTRVGDGQTPMAMARAFQIPKTSLTHTLAGLEKKGLIDMRPNPQDGRSKCVWLTDAGRAWRMAAIEGMAPDMVKVAEAFAPEKVTDLVKQLSELRAFLDAARD